MSTITRKLSYLCLTAGLLAAVGCQTHIGGMTLPSPNYLNENPDYIQQAPAFPLSKELASMQEAAANAER